MERNGTKVIIRDLCKSFGANGASKAVLAGLTLELRNGEFTTIVGPNGCGKTTLLNLIAGLIVPESGVCKVETTDGRQPQVGYVWQNYRASLLPWLSILENVAFPLRLRGQGRAEREQTALQLLERFMPGIDPRQPSYGMSGGQQQLVCLLRSATIQPDVLLLDEPFSALDQ
ncbi:MAG: ATP-binding cassette domain-containing protein, partial [bacterium]